MKENDIIVLENDERYTLLKEIKYEGDRYFMAAGIDKDENIDRKKIAILKHVKEKDGDYVEIVKDENLINKLSTEFEGAFKEELQNEGK